MNLTTAQQGATRTDGVRVLKQISGLEYRRLLSSRASSRLLWTGAPRDMMPTKSNNAE